MRTLHRTKRIRFIGCVSVAVIVFALVCTVLYLSPGGRFLRYYGEAEQIVNEVIIPFRNEMAELQTEPRQLLKLTKYSELKHRVLETELENGELIRFRINDMFDIGVGDDGAIIWYQL